jgi:hypothetical protein
MNGSNPTTNDPGAPLTPKSSTVQWIRKASLSVVKTPTQATTTPTLNFMEDFHFKFNVRHSDQVLTSASVRIYNLKKETETQIQNEFTRIVINAGYHPPAAVGVIFDGTIKVVRRGRESNVDNYMDIVAATCDLPYNFGVVNTTLGPGASLADIMAAGVKGMNDSRGANDLALTLKTSSPLPAVTFPRGAVLYGMAYFPISDVCQTTGSTWYFDGSGNVQVIPLTGYVPGEVVIIDSATGLVGIPELTVNGVEFTCLLNPKLRIGSLVKIDNKTVNINATLITDRSAVGPIPESSPFFASESADGLYRCAVIDYEGDTRGTPWYSHVTALAVNPALPFGASVQRFGA